MPSIMYSVVLLLMSSTIGNGDEGTTTEVVWGQDGDTEGGGGVTVGLVTLV